MSEITHLMDYGNNVVAFYNDGRREIAYQSSSGLWIINEQEVVVIPPGSNFIYPFNFDLATSPYGLRVNPFDPTKTTFHNGIDGSTAAGVGNGANVICAGDGVVLAAGNVRSGWGNGIIVDHGTFGGDRLWTGYAHMQSGSPFFDAGDAVNQSEVLGLVGTTGVSTGPHLHFATWVNGAFVNPSNFMRTYA